MEGPTAAAFPWSQGPPWYIGQPGPGWTPLVPPLEFPLPEVPLPELFPVVRPVEPLVPLDEVLPRDVPLILDEAPLD